MLLAQMLIDRAVEAGYPDSIYILEFYGEQKDGKERSLSSLRNLNFIKRVSPYKPHAYMLIVEPGKVDTFLIKEVLRDEGIEKYRIIH